MNLRKIYGELTKPHGRMLLFVAIFLLTLFFFKTWKSRQSSVHTAVTANISAETSSTPPPSESKGYSFRTNVPEPTPPTKKERKSEDHVISRVLTGASTQHEEPPPPISQTIFARKEADFAVSDEFLPFGQLIKCQLANTIESTNIDTPIFGYVIEDVYGPGGNLIIPAGTEVHGDALKASSRERIGAQNKFVLVFIENGKELKVTASILDHAPSRHSPDKWATSDGSGGLRGYQIKLDQFAEAKAILGSMLSAGASAFPQQINQSGPFGNITSTSPGGWQAALSEGIGAGADIYAQRLIESMKELYYVRVDAGTYFYLYTRQTISLADAQIGGSKEKSLETQTVIVQ